MNLRRRSLYLNPQNIGNPFILNSAVDIAAREHSAAQPQPNLFGLRREPRKHSGHAALEALSAVEKRCRRYAPVFAALRLGRLPPHSKILAAHFLLLISYSPLNFQPSTPQRGVAAWRPVHRSPAIQDEVGSFTRLYALNSLIPAVPGKFSHAVAIGQVRPLVQNSRPVWESSGPDCRRQSAVAEPVW